MIKHTVGSAAAMAMMSGPGMRAALVGQALHRARIYEPRLYGAKGDGTTLDTHALQAAIDACTSSGGGTVLLDSGTYVSGTITLKSNVTLELQQGATILGSPNPEDYVLPPEGIAAGKQPNAKRLIFALSAQNVSIVGPGTIDGNNKHFMVSSNRPSIRPGDEYRDIAAFGTHRTVGISPMIQLVACTNVRVENILLQNADGWTLSPMGCTQVVIHKVTVRNAIDASNTDGIDPASCQDVLIADCDIATGDDGICVKSLNQYGVGCQTSKNIRVINCKVTSCTNALRVGVEGWGGAFEDISFTDCEVYAVKGPLNTSPAAGICVIMQDGTLMNGVSFTNIRLTGARVPIYVRLQTLPSAMKKRLATGAPLTGSMQNISFNRIHAVGAIFTSSITGIGDLHLRNVSLTDIEIQTSEPGQLAWTQTPVNEAEIIGAGPYAFGRLPCYGLYLRHIEGLTLKNVNVCSQFGDPRPMLMGDDITQATLQNVSGTAPDSTQPLIELKNFKEAKIMGNKAPASKGPFARISGADTKDVRFRENDFTKSESPVVQTIEVHEDAVGSIY